MKITKAKQLKLERKELKARDKEWSKKVREIGYCLHCGRTENLNACHIIPREIRAFRHDLENGICLCAKCHKFSYQFSNHKNSFAFLLWFKEKFPEQFNNLKIKWDNYKKILDEAI